MDEQNQAVIRNAKIIAFVDYQRSVNDYLFAHVFEMVFFLLDDFLSSFVLGHVAFFGSGGLSCVSF